MSPHVQRILLELSSNRPNMLCDIFHLVISCVLRKKILGIVKLKIVSICIYRRLDALYT